MENNKVYLVSAGDYSDYHICAAFTSEENAQMYIYKFDTSEWERMRIEEYDLNPYEYELKKGYNPYFVRMTKDGECTEIRISGSTYGFDGTNEVGFDLQKNMYMRVMAKDEQHAIKIVNEHRGQLIALDRWKK